MNGRAPLGNRNAIRTADLRPADARCGCGERAVMLTRVVRRGVEVNCPRCGRWQPAVATRGQA